MMVPLGTKGGKSALIRLTPLSEQSPICFIIFNRLSPARPKQESPVCVCNTGKSEKASKESWYETRNEIQRGGLSSRVVKGAALWEKINEKQKDPGFAPGLGSLYKMFWAKWLQ